MKQSILSILLFPLDLIYMTIDAGIITSRTIKRKLAKEKLQRSHFCEGEANADSPHVVRSVLKYQNKWMVRLLAPSIVFKSDGKRRIGFCSCDEGYVQVPGYVPALFTGMLVLWGSLLFGTLRAVSSDPENFSRNFVSTFNPATLGDDEEEVDFLEMGESRLNPEKAERYYLSGIRFLDQQKFANAQVDLKIGIQANPADSKLHFSLARAYLGTGQRVQAEASLRKALEFDEDNVEAMLLLSELVQRQEKPEEARQLAEKALALEPDNLQAVRLNAGLLASAGDREAARPLMDQLLQADGDNPNTLSFIGRLELALFQDVEASRALLEKALELDSEHIPSKLAMINIHAQDQDIQLVDQTLNEILELDPQHLEARRLQAELMLNRYGLPAGLRAYQALLTEFGGNLQFRLRYAELLLRAGRISEGKNIAQQLTASRVPGVERAAHWMLAQMYAQVRMFDDALQHGQSTLRLSPNARGVHLFLAQNFLNLNQPAEAKREAEMALAQNRQDIQAVNLLTQAMVRLGQTDEAVATLTRLLEEYPEQDALKMRRIEILMQTPSWQNALSDTQVLLEKYPDNAALKNNMAFLLARSGQDLEKASELVESLMEEFSENPVIMDTHAYVFAAKGNHEAALPIYEQALSKAGGNVTIRFHYAKSLAALGRAGDAAEQLKAVLIMNPDFPQAEEARGMLQSLAGTGA